MKEKMSLWRSKRPRHTFLYMKSVAKSYIHASIHVLMFLYTKSVAMSCDAHTHACTHARAFIRTASLLRSFVGGKGKERAGEQQQGRGERESCESE